MKNSDLNSGRNNYLTKQQTPNPLAQFPWFTPPLSPHSVEVKQVPKVLPPSILVVHSTLSNWTTENNEKDSKRRKWTEKQLIQITYLPSRSTDNFIFGSKHNWKIAIVNGSKIILISSNKQCNCISYQWFFSSFPSFKNIDLGDHLWIFFFVTSNFEPLYFLKWQPIFDIV